MFLEKNPLVFTGWNRQAGTHVCTEQQGWSERAHVQTDHGQRWTKNQVYHKTLRVSQNPTTVQLKTKKWQIYMKSGTSPPERRRILYIIFIYIFTRYIHIVYKNVYIDSYLWCKSSKGNVKCRNFNTTNSAVLKGTDRNDSTGTRYRRKEGKRGEGAQRRWANEVAVSLGDCQ